MVASTGPEPRDKFIEDMKEAGSTADGDCIDGVFENYTDDEIEALSNQGTDERSVALATDLLACTDLSGG